jgi:nitrous oxidase accessory protein NosD
VRRRATLWAGALLLAVAGVANATSTWTVCPAAATGCQFEGMDGLQRAVDRAADGDTIRLRGGRYVPQGTRDVPYDKLTIRGAVLLDGRRLTLRGDDGVTFDGSAGTPSSAIVVRGGRVSLQNLRIEGYRAANTEDDTYDGHGLFFIDADADVEDVTIVGVAKMALTARGGSQVRAHRLQILDGHVGIWLEETARLALDEATVRNNDSAGICAYGKSSARIRRSTFEANRDDGVYTEGQATIEVLESEVTRNAPYGLRAVGQSRITSTRNRLDANATAPTATEGEGRVVVD